MRMHSNIYYSCYARTWHARARVACATGGSRLPVGSVSFDTNFCGKRAHGGSAAVQKYLHKHGINHDARTPHLRPPTATQPPMKTPRARKNAMPWGADPEGSMARNHAGIAGTAAYRYAPSPARIVDHAAVSLELWTDYEARLLSDSVT